MGKQDKTNCMRVLESKKIPYTPHLYEADPSLSGEDIARILGEEPSQVFKTLVTTGKPQRYYVFVIPVNAELNPAVVFCRTRLMRALIAADPGTILPAWR